MDMSLVENTSFYSASREASNTPLKIPKTRTTAIQLPTNLEDVLVNFVQRSDVSTYEHLVCVLKNCDINDNDLESLLSSTSKIISLLDEDLHHFVEVLLSVKWLKRGQGVACKYRRFLIDLLSAHNYYTEQALGNLVDSFKTENEAEWVDGTPSEEEALSFQNAHLTLQVLLKIIPMSCSLLVKVIDRKFPYFKRSAHWHESYVYNMLRLIEHQPELRLDLLLIIVNRLLILDVHSPKSEIEEFEEHASSAMETNNSEPEMFSMEGSDANCGMAPPAKMSHPIAHNFDLALNQLFKYLRRTCFIEPVRQSVNEEAKPPGVDWTVTKGLYHDMLTVFDRLVLPAHETHHVQFIMFFITSFNSTIAEIFLSYLWRKVTSVTESPVIRQTSVLYIASLLARATFIPMMVLKTTISRMALWIHNYISNQDGLEKSNSDLRVHSVFFAVCQALFYVIAFRHRDLVKTRKNLTFLQSLNVTRMVTCRLNPLRVCIPPVVQNFAAVTRTYQLAYCYTIIEHNARNVLPIVYQDNNGISVDYIETFFPFDPFLLVRSGAEILPIYREYQGAEAPSEDHLQYEDEEELDIAAIKKEEDDDFLSELASSTMNADMFSYGSSPGFKHM